MMTQSQLVEYYDYNSLENLSPPYQILPKENRNVIKLEATKIMAVDPNLAIWAVVHGVLLVFILGGNFLTILAVRFSRRLRSIISNLFVLSLAISDTLVGFTLPYHLAFYMGSGLGENRELCLLRFFLIILACCNSIWNLIAIAVDRYIAIFYPLHYGRYMTKKVAVILLGFGWIVGIAFASVPLFWNNWETAKHCEFDEILKPWYMAGVITPGFSMVWVCMLIVYWRIWREATKHAKQLRSSFTGLHETPSDSKSVQVVLFILGCFSFCWLPYFIIACVQIFNYVDKSSPMLYKAAFSLAMANSGMNPIIYAWKNTGFRRAFSRLLKCQSPDYNDASQHSIRSQMHRKSSSVLQKEYTTNATTVINDSSVMNNPSIIKLYDVPNDNFDSNAAIKSTKFEKDVATKRKTSLKSVEIDNDKGQNNIQRKTSFGTVTTTIINSSNDNCKSRNSYSVDNSLENIQKSASIIVSLDENDFIKNNMQCMENSGHNLETKEQNFGIKRLITSYQNAQLNENNEVSTSSIILSNECNQSPEILSLKNYRQGFIVQQIERDGNGNTTQICILNPKELGDKFSHKNNINLNCKLLNRSTSLSIGNTKENQTNKIECFKSYVQPQLGNSNHVNDT